LGRGEFAGQAAARMPVTAERTCASASRATRWHVADFAAGLPTASRSNSLSASSLLIADQRQRVGRAGRAGAADAFALGMVGAAALVVAQLEFGFAQRVLAKVEIEPGNANAGDAELIASANQSRPAVLHRKQRQHDAIQHRRP